MQDVTIYIETSIHGPNKKDGEYLYLLECMRNGTPITRDGRGKLEKATENQLAMTALLEALKRLTCPCAVVVYTSCAYIASALNNRWAEDWRQRGWIRKDGKSVKNAELWEEIMEQLDPHMYLCSTVPHSYSDWMARQINPCG